MTFDQSLQASHFLGRDGFRFWLGKVPVTIDSEKNYGESVRVRILGYHTEDTSILPDQDLPLALIKKPVTVGGDNGQSSAIVGGELVSGYFSDGDDAQIPVIDGILDRWSNQTTFSKQELLDGANPFKSGPLYAFNNIPDWRIKSEGKNPDKESLLAEQGKTSNPSGEVAVNQVRDGTPAGAWVPSSRSVLEESILAEEFNGPNNCGDDIVSRIRVEISKIVVILNGVKKYYNTYVVGAINKTYDFIGQINSVIENIAAVMRTIVQRIRNFVLRKLRELLSAALELVLGDVLKDIKDAVISEILDIIFCIFQTTIEDLPGLIGDFVAALIGQLAASPLCAAEKFMNALVNNVVNSIQGVLDPIIDDISDLLNGVLDIGSAISSAIDQVLGVLGFLCLTKNCVEVTKFNSTPFGGPTKKMQDDYSNFLGQINIPPIVESAEQWLNEAGLTDGGFSNCDIANADKCGPPLITIFGGNPTSEAIASAVINKKGSVIGALLERRGLGYKNPPFVAFDDPCGLGVGAGGYAVLDPIDGSIKDIIITNPGYGYIEAPDGSDNSDPNPIQRKPIGGDDSVIKDPDDGSNVVDPGKIIPDPDDDGGGESPGGPGNEDDQIVLVPVVGCLEGITVANTGFGYAQDDEIVTIPEMPGLILEGQYTDSGQLIQILVKGETCGWKEIPEIEINSKTGAGVNIKPILSFTKASDFVEEEAVKYQNSTLSVVQCIKT